MMHLFVRLFVDMKNKSSLDDDFEVQFGFLCLLFILESNCEVLVSTFFRKYDFLYHMRGERGESLVWWRCRLGTVIVIV